MKYNDLANVPEIHVTAEFDELNSSDPIYLAEFVMGPPVREILMDVDGNIIEEVKIDGDDTIDESIPNLQAKPLAAAKGLRLHRVYDIYNNIVTEYDAKLDKTPLKPLLDNVYFITAHPGDTYTWKILKLGKYTEGKDIIPIVGIRDATETETNDFNEIFPNWLRLVKELDLQILKDEELDKQTLNLPTPILPPLE
jgi:hypothetical protein